MLILISSVYWTNHALKGQVPYLTLKCLCVPRSLKCCIHYNYTHFKWLEASEKKSAASKLRHEKDVDTSLKGQDQTDEIKIRTKSGFFWWKSSADFIWTFQLSLTAGLTAVRGLFDLVPWATCLRLFRAEVQRPQRATGELRHSAAFCRQARISAYISRGVKFAWE